jgi:hypothetical protein
MTGTPRSVRLIALFGVSVSLIGGLKPAHADDPCAAFTWDVRHERTLFTQAPQAVVAEQALAVSPTLATDQLYQLKLRRQSEVSFATPPGRKPDDGTYAGLARLTVDTTGVYRVALDQPLWVDVLANGSLVRAKDFQGRPGCNAPHKIVEFLLPARTPITLQFSGGSTPTVEVTVTRSPEKGV